MRVKTKILSGGMSLCLTLMAQADSATERMRYLYAAEEAISAP